MIPAEKIKLTKNMRVLSDPIFSAFLLHIGDGMENIIIEDTIELPSQIVILYIHEKISLNLLINHMFPILQVCASNMEKMTYCAILTP